MTLRASGLTGLNICTLQISVLLVLGRASQYYVRLRLIVTDRVAWSVGRSVDRFVTVVRPIPFGLRPRVGPRNHVLDGSISP